MCLCWPLYICSECIPLCPEQEYVVALREIITSRGGGCGRSGDCFLSYSSFPGVFVEPVFNDNIATTAASSSGTSDSSTFGSGVFLIKVA